MVELVYMGLARPICGCQQKSIPTASLSWYKSIIQYVGDTNANYTNGFFYRCDREQIPSSISAAVAAGSTGITAVTVTKSTFETKISATGTYSFVYNGSNWTLDSAAIGDITTYGLTITASSAVATVAEGYPERLGTITVNAAEFAGFADETGDYTFIYDGEEEEWKYEDEPVTLATYGISGIEDPEDGDEFTINFTKAGPHEGDTIEVDYTEMEYSYSWTKINVQ